MFFFLNPAEDVYNMASCVEGGPSRCQEAGRDRPSADENRKLDPGLPAWTQMAQPM